jgi:hypothetical protein
MACNLRHPRADWNLSRYRHCSRIPRWTTSLFSRCSNLGSMAQAYHRAVKHSVPLAFSAPKPRMEGLLTKLQTAAHRLYAHNRFPHHNSPEVSPDLTASPPRHLHRSIFHKYHLVQRRAITKRRNRTHN